MTASPGATLKGQPDCHSLNAEDLCRLAELSFDGMAAHRDGRIFWANRAAARLLGVGEADELLGATITEFIPRTMEKGITDEISVSFAMRRPSVSQFPVLRRNGEVFQAEVHRHPTPDGAMLVVFRDLEGRMQSQREMRSAELRARAFFDATGEAMGMSRMGRHLEVNRAYARLFGYDDPKELAGRPFLEIIAPEDQARVAEIKRRRACGEPAPELYTVTGQRRDGTPLPLEIRVSAYLDIDDVVTIIVARDLTQQKVEEERRVHREKLEAIGRLAGGVAHDFNNLLTAIMGNVDLSLAHAEGDVAMQNSLLTIREASERAADLVKQILAFGRREQPPPRPLDLTQTVNDALGLVRSMVPAAVKLETKIDAVPGTVLAAATQVHQVLLNLCSNARDAVQPGGHISVRLEHVEDVASVPELTSGAWARLRVSDDGDGMDQSIKARLFEPYHTTKAERGGHGLGLAVVHGIVSSLGAVIRVASEAGKGSTFDVYFPLTEAPMPKAVTQKVLPGSKEHILLVEDEPLVRSSVKRLLVSLGYVVTVANDGVEALALLREKPGSVDLVLSDISMPRLSGLEMTRMLLAEQPHAKVILYTGFTDRLEEVTSHSLGIKRLLAKPVSRDTLSVALREALTGVVTVAADAS